MREGGEKNGKAGTGAGREEGRRMWSRKKRRRGGEKNVMSGKQHCYYQVNEGSYPSTLLVTRAHHIPNALAIRT